MTFQWRIAVPAGSVRRGDNDRARGGSDPSRFAQAHSAGCDGTQRLRVAVVGTRGVVDVQGGIETYCRSVYPYLAERGCEVVVFTRRGYGDRSIDVFRGVRLVPIWCPRSKYAETPIHTLLA